MEQKLVDIVEIDVEVGSWYSKWQKQTDEPEINTKMKKRKEKKLT